MAAYLYSLAFDSCRLGPAHGLPFFFFTEDFFCYSRARIDTEYFFHESTLLYFFNTLMLRVRNAEIYRLVRCHVTKILVSVVLFMAMMGLFPLLDELLCTRLSNITFGF